MVRSLSGLRQERDAFRLGRCPQILVEAGERKLVCNRRREVGCIVACESMPLSKPGNETAFAASGVAEGKRFEGIELHVEVRKSQTTAPARGDQKAANLVPKEVGSHGAFSSHEVGKLGHGG